MPCGYKDTAFVVPEFESNVMGYGNDSKIGRAKRERNPLPIGEGGLVQASLDHSQH